MKLPSGAPPALLTMQKVEGSNPFSRSQRDRNCRSFSWAQSACASASGRTDSALAAARSSAVPRKTRCLQADSGSSEPKSFCGPAEGRVSCLLRPLARLLLQRDDPADSGHGPWGPVRFQSGNREVDLGPLRDPASDGPQSCELSRTTASEAAARCPSRGACAAAVTRGHLRGRRFPSASRRPRVPGLGCWLSSAATVIGAGGRVPQLL